jgi:transcriptional regulator with XRE-family HTH domain
MGLLNELQSPELSRCNSNADPFTFRLSRMVLRGCHGRLTPQRYIAREVLPSLARYYRDGDILSRGNSLGAGFGTRLGLAMQRCGLNQSELARELGTSQSAVSAWLAGGKLPEGKLMVQLPGVLRASGHWLLTGEGSPTTEKITQDRFTATLAALADIADHARKAHALAEHVYGIVVTPSRVISTDRDAEIAASTIDAVEVEQEEDRADVRPRPKPKGKGPRRRAAGD